VYEKPYEVTNVKKRNVYEDGIRKQGWGGGGVFFVRRIYIAYRKYIAKTGISA